MQAGERKSLADLGLGERLEVRVTCDLSGTDISAIGLQGGKLSDDRYMVFYNQPRSPEGAIVQRSAGEFAFDLAALPASITEIYLTATHDTQPVGRAGRLSVSFGTHTFDVKPYLSAEKAVMLIRLYRHNGQWRLATVAQGFNGGLGALIEHFGGEVADAPAPAPAPTKLSLVKEQQRILLEKAERQQPKLVSLIKQASLSLEKRGLGEARYRVNLVLDISGSMHNEYQSGAVQALAERALALAARLDDDGEVEVYLFGERAHRKGNLSLDNVSGFVQRMQIDLEGGTNYAPVMRLVRQDAQAAGYRWPTLVLFITDGGTTNRNEVVQTIVDSSREPIFWKFMGIQQGVGSSGGLLSGFFNRMAQQASAEGFGFLQKLDDLEGRTVDNADFFSVPAPIQIPDAQLFDLLLNELESWQVAARQAGVLTSGNF